MRELAAVTLLAVLCLFCVPASADTLDRVSPSTIFLGDTEADITLFGTGFLGSGGTTLVNFSGPAGSFSLEPTSIDPFGTVMHTSVPFQVALTVGSHTISVTVTDAQGTRTFGAGTLNVEQQVITGPPLLNIPEFVIVEAESSRGSTVTYEASATSYVDPTVNVTCTPPSGSLFPLGFSTVRCTATDSIGTTNGGFQVLVVDTVAPILTLPGNISQTDPVVTFTATAVDEIDGPVTVFCNPPSGSTFPGGTTQVICSAFDSFLNQASGTFLVTLPGGATQLILPADITVEATSAAGAQVSYVASASDGSAVSCTPTSGSLFPIGVTTVQCSGGNAFGTFDVSVRDTTPPVLSPQPNIVIEATSCTGGSVVTWPPITAVDLVDGALDVTCTHESGSLFPFGVTPVQCTASDSYSNTGSRTFTVTVQDTTAPVISSITATPSFLWPPNHKMVVVTISVTATDPTGCPVTSTVTSITSSDSDNGTGDGNTTDDYRITGPLTVELRAEKAQRGERRYTITVQAVDSNNNKTTGTVVVRVANPNNP